MTRWKNPLLWFRGLLAGFIGGGAGAVTSGFIAVGQTPEQYNLKDGATNLLVMIGGALLTLGYPPRRLFSYESERECRTRVVGQASCIVCRETFDWTVERERNLRGKKCGYQGGHTHRCAMLLRARWRAEAAK